MALFKILKGDSSNLSKQNKKNGYCYFTKDEQLFYVDYKLNEEDPDDNTHTFRAPINAGKIYRVITNDSGDTVIDDSVNNYAMNGATLAFEVNETHEEIPSSKAVLILTEAINEKIENLEDSKMDRVNPTGSGTFTFTSDSNYLFKVNDSGILLADVFTVDADGLITTTNNINAVNGVFAGDIYATNGTFTGDINAANATFLGDINAVNSIFTGNISAVNGTFSSDINAVNGIFTGDINAVNANLLGDIEAINIVANEKVTAYDISVDNTLSAANAEFLTSVKTAILPVANDDITNKEYVDTTINDSIALTHQHIIAITDTNEFIFSNESLTNLEDKYLIFFNGLLLAPRTHYKANDNSTGIELAWQAKAGDICHIIGPRFVNDNNFALQEVSATPDEIMLNQVAYGITKTGESDYIIGEFTLEDELTNQENLLTALEDLL